MPKKMGFKRQPFSLTDVQRPLKVTPLERVHVCLCLDKPVSSLVNVSELNHSTQRFRTRGRHLSSMVHISEQQKVTAPWHRLWSWGGVGFLLHTPSALTGWEAIDGHSNDALKIYEEQTSGESVLCASDWWCSLLFYAHNILMKVGAIIISNIHSEK